MLPRGLSRCRCNLTARHQSSSSKARAPAQNVLQCAATTPCTTHKCASPSSEALTGLFWPRRGPRRPPAAGVPKHRAPRPSTHTPVRPTSLFSGPCMTPPATGSRRGKALAPARCCGCTADCQSLCCRPAGCCPVPSCLRMHWKLMHRWHTHALLAPPKAGSITLPQGKCELGRGCTGRDALSLSRTDACMCPPVSARMEMAMATMEAACQSHGGICRQGCRLD